MMRTLIATAIAMLALGAVVGGVIARDRASSDAADRESTIRALSFETPGPEARRTVLALGGLEVDAACQRYGPPNQPTRGFDGLSVTARSAVGGASIVSSFLQREGAKGPATYPYVFAVRDFGPDYGAYDFLGTPYKVTGDLHYARPDGGNVTVSYAANQQRLTDGCSFSGTAVYAATG